MSKINFPQQPQLRQKSDSFQQTASQTQIKSSLNLIDQHINKSVQSAQLDEESKIYKALSTCYDAYLEGNKDYMSKIVNEMSNRHKEKEHIKMWLRASTKKLIDLYRNKQDVNYLVEVILYNMPWFEAGNEYEIELQQQEKKKQEQLYLQQSQTHQQSQINQQLISAHHQHQIGSDNSLFSNCSSSKRNIKPQSQIIIKKPTPHFELFGELSKFILTLLSFSNAFAPQIIKFLISNIVPMEIKELEKNKKSEIEIEVEGKLFENQKKLLMYIRDCLNKYVLNSISDVQELNKDDTIFLLGVLKYHPNAKEKLTKYKKILIGQAQFDDKISRCLYIQNKDSQKIDISYVKSVQNLVDEQFQKIGLKQGSPNQKKMMLQVVELLAKIIKIYPLYQNDLCRIVQDSYPHRVQGEQFHKIYLTNILQLAIKYPQLMPKILVIAVQKLIEIDSEIKLDHQEGVDNEKTSQIMAEKLDWLMLIIFEFIDYQLKDKVGSDNCFGEIQKDEQYEKQREQVEEKFFRMFLNIFSEQILITHQSKYVQFLIFYLCSLRSKFQNVFLNHLITNITKKNPLLYKSTQINSIYYLGSYLARAKYVKSEQIHKIFEFLIDYLKNYIQKFDERQKEDNYNEGLHKIHQNLYHLLQAMLYIMCFRFNSISEGNNNILQRFFEILKQACSNFNALFFISPNVQIVFMEVCQVFEQSQFYELLEIKSKNNQESESISAASQQRAQILDMYFPFDPYCLQYSDKYICEIYQNWQDFNAQQSQSNLSGNQSFSDKQINSSNPKQNKSKRNSVINRSNIVSNNSISINAIQNPCFNNSLNNSFIGNTSNNAAMSNGNNNSRYGFTIDKLNNINDLEYDRDNMIDDEEEINEQILNHVLPDNYDNESDLELQIQSSKYNDEKKNNMNGKRKHPISTTDNSANNTPIDNNEDDSNQNQHKSNSRKNSKKLKKSKQNYLYEDDYNNASFGYKKMNSSSSKDISS